MAQLAGVSHQTVSRVVNRHPSVSATTRLRVMEAIRELDYAPNRVAQSLATQRSKSVGIIGYGTTHYGPSQMVSHIEADLKAKGYALVYAAVPDLSVDVLREQIATLRDQLVDGLVLITPVGGGHLLETSGLIHVPFVMIDAMLGEHVPSVVIHQRHGARLATQHLIDMGHREICEISGPMEWTGARQRHDGWLATLRDAAIAPGASVDGDWTAASGYEAARRLLAQRERFTALFVGNDQMALGAMRALREAGRSLPDDVSVVGFDDIPEAAYFEPPLTTIRQDFTTLGQQAVELLLARMADPEAPAHQRVLYPQLIERQSVSRPER
ncbi:MAG: LacI family DNA-binding transcriptional regulator [Deinococcales bacterium]